MLYSTNCIALELTGRHVDEWTPIFQFMNDGGPGAVYGRSVYFERYLSPSKAPLDVQVQVLSQLSVLDLVPSTGIILYVLSTFTLSY